MKTHLRMAAALAAVALVFGSGRADEEKVPEDKIPKAVMDALKARFPKAKIDSCVKEKDGDAVIYDIEIKEGDRKCEADIREDGTYVNFEKAIPEKDLPKAVREAIDKKYPKAVFKEVMEETEVKGKEEKLSAYEVVMTTAEKKEVEVRVSPDGKILEDSSEEKKPEVKKEEKKQPEKK